jgi:hypothetical protein
VLPAVQALGTLPLRLRGATMIELLIVDPDGATLVPPRIDPCDPTIKVASGAILDAVFCNTGPYLKTLRFCGLRSLAEGANRRHPFPFMADEPAWWMRRVWTLRRYGWWEPRIRRQAIVDDRGGWPDALRVAPGIPYSHAPLMPVPYPRGGQRIAAQRIADETMRFPVIPGVFVGDTLDGTTVADPLEDYRIEWWGPLWLQLPQWWQEFLSWLFWYESEVRGYLQLWWRHPAVELTAKEAERAKKVTK